MKIRKATFEDIDYIFEWYSRVAQNDLDSGASDVEVKFTTNKTLTEIAWGVVCEEDCYLIAEEDWKRAGFLTWDAGSTHKYFGMKNIASLNFLLVEDEFRHKWFWDALIKEFTKWAKEKKADALEIYVVPENKEAVDFYDKHGFKTKLLCKYKKL